MVPSFFAAGAYALLRWARPLSLLELALTVALLKPMFAIRSLRDAAFAVRDALSRGDLPSARRALAACAAARADDLNAEELVAATIESVAEELVRQHRRPLFFFACGGVPGAVFYRAVNTLDAMVGYHGHLEYAGKASARLDDLLNLLPARMTALLLLAAGAFTGQSAAGGRASFSAIRAAPRAPTRGGRWRRWRVSSGCGS